LSEGTNVAYISGASFDGSLAEDVLAGLIVVEDVRDRPAGHSEGWKLALENLLVHLPAQILKGA